VRQIGDADLTDAVSPYGYPGAAISGTAAPPPDPASIDWAGTGLVSVFARERIGADPCFAGATARSSVQVHDPSRDRRLRGRFAEQIRRNARLGYTVEVVPGPDASVERRSSFHALYAETMDRAEAAARYFFDLDYFKAVLAFERSWLVLCHAPEGDPAAGAIAALSDGLLHYYLGGTADAHLRRSPFKNVADSMTRLAEDLQVPLNLGGGVRPGDGLEDFKRGFANAELPFNTHEIVCDREAYARLSAGRAETDYFPAYRALTR
jgi:Acetyltransferase (GNAT) domain